MKKMKMKLLDCTLIGLLAGTALQAQAQEAASTAPVLLSNPISPEGPVISRIPPSIRS